MIFFIDDREFENLATNFLKKNTHNSNVTAVRNIVPFHKNFIIFEFFRPKSLYLYTYKFFTVYGLFSKICTYTYYYQKSVHIRIILKNQYIYVLFSKISTYMY